jgi:tRNA (guanine-N7-)-methyltransferase
VIELIPESYFARLDLVRIFGRVAPLQVDLGCGDGSFLVALAERYPEKSFLGIERLAGRVAKTCRKAARIGNVRVLRLETSYAIRYLLPEHSVEAFYLLFPDPWPKRRHQRRRVVSSDFLQSIHRALTPNGLLRMATDQRDYFQQMQRLAAGDSRFEIIDTGNDVYPFDCRSHRGGQAGQVLPVTKFERRFQEQGEPIYRLSLRKASPVT